MLRSGSQWRLLPKDFPPWQTVYSHWRRWISLGIIKKLLDLLRKKERLRQGRQATPTALIIDSQSIKASSSARQDVGYDGGKRINGRKHHLLVDSMGNLVDVVVHRADIQDRDGAKLLLKQFAHTATTIRIIWADGGYRGQLQKSVSRLRHRNRIKLCIVNKLADQQGFQVLPRRWVVERTNAWMVACRRLVRAYDQRTEITESFIRLAMIRLLLRRQK